MLLSACHKDWRWTNRLGCIDRLTDSLQSSDKYHACVACCQLVDPIDHRGMQSVESTTLTSQGHNPYVVGCCFAPVWWIQFPFPEHPRAVYLQLIWAVILAAGQIRCDVTCKPDAFVLAFPTFFLSEGNICPFRSWDQQNKKKMSWRLLSQWSYVQRFFILLIHEVCFPLLNLLLESPFCLLGPQIAQA